jgi:hypothetical protein
VIRRTTLRIIITATITIIIRPIVLRIHTTAILAEGIPEGLTAAGTADTIERPPKKMRHGPRIFYHRTMAQ